jgi:hypothetical protein
MLGVRRRTNPPAPENASPAFDRYPPSCRYNVVAYARVLGPPAARGGPTTVVEVRIALARCPSFYRIRIPGAEHQTSLRRTKMLARYFLFLPNVV